MANLQVGNRIGVTARGPSSPLLAAVVGDGANIANIAPADTKNFYTNMAFEVFVRATGVSKGTRNVTIVDALTGNIWYDGADITVTNADGLYRPGAWAGPPTNLNGGSSSGAGLVLTGQGTVDDMRQRLKIINPTYYTDALLNALTENDLVYAIRLADASASV